MRRPLALLALALVLTAVIWRVGSRPDGRGAPSVSPGAPRPDGVATADGDLAPAQRSAAEGGRTEAQERTAPVSDPGPAAHDGATGSLLLRAATREGTPVPGVAVYVTPMQGPRTGHGTTEHATDEGGIARVADLPPGRVSIYCPHGPYEGADVVAGEETEVLLEFESVLDVQGIVRDPEGRPVAGADVWLLSWRRDWLGTVHVTRTGSGGEFTVRNVSAGKSLGATAAGFAPSEPVDLEMVDTERSPVAIELQLTAGGGALTGRVLDPEGAPVAGARVAVGESPRDYSMRHDGTVQESWCPRVETTDAAGSFAFAGLEADSLPLHVLALDHPEYADEVAIPVDGTAHVDVRLLRGMSVRGVVRDEAGEAVSEALVLALDAPFVDPFPTQGPTERGAPFHRPATRSDDQGGYLLDRLPPGAVHLYASKGTSFWDDGDFLGTVQETLEGEPGETLEWDPVLSRGSEIRGRVSYADGKPMGHVFVSATDSDDRRYTEHCDEEGRFAIPGLEPRAYRVAVQFWDAPDGARPLEQEGVWPAESELALTASFSKVVLEEATVRVRIDDRADRLRGKGAVVFGHEGGWYYSEEEDGVFSTKLPPGRYQARAMSGDTIVGTSGWFDLDPGEERDLGSIATLGAGSLVVQARRPPELAESSVYVSVETDYGPRRGGRELPEDDELVFEDLLEGEVEITLGGAGVAVESRTVSIRADSPTTVELQLWPAERVTLHVSAAPSEGFGRLEIAIRNADGSPYSTLDYYERWGAKLPLEARTYVPEGRFTVSATTTSGLTASGALVVDATAEEASLSLVLE